MNAHWMVQEAWQVAAGSYAKSFAALRQQTPEMAQELTSAIACLHQLAGELYPPAFNPMSS